MLNKALVCTQDSADEAAASTERRIAMAVNLGILPAPSPAVNFEILPTLSPEVVKKAVDQKDIPRARRRATVPQST
jgi:hypothetical protein